MGSKSSVDAASATISEDASVADPDALAKAIIGPAAVEAEVAIAAQENTPSDATNASDPETQTSTDAHAADAIDAMSAAARAREPHRIAKPAPSFVRAAGARPQPAAKRDWRSIAAISGLILLLAMQSLLADRAALAANAHWRPVIATLCGVLRCTMPPWREPAAFTVIARDVRPHPTIPGALRVTASFRNDARWPQPWPRLALTLSDVDGREAGKRDFGVAEYLGAAPAQTLLKPGQVATIAMDVIEPAPRIVAFTFDFH